MVIGVFCLVVVVLRGTHHSWRDWFRGIGLKYGPGGEVRRPKCHQVRSPGTTPCLGCEGRGTAIPRRGASMRAPVRCRWPSCELRWCSSRFGNLRLRCGTWSQAGRSRTPHPEEPWSGRERRLTCYIWLRTSAKRPFTRASVVWGALLFAGATYSRRGEIPMAGCVYFTSWARVLVSSAIRFRICFW